MEQPRLSTESDSPVAATAGPVSPLPEIAATPAESPNAARGQPRIRTPSPIQVEEEIREDSQSYRSRSPTSPSPKLAPRSRSISPRRSFEVFGEENIGDTNAMSQITSQPTERSPPGSPSAEKGPTSAPVSGPDVAMASSTPPALSFSRSPSSPADAGTDGVEIVSRAPASPLPATPQHRAADPLPTSPPEPPTPAVFTSPPPAPTTMPVSPQQRDYHGATPSPRPPPRTTVPAGTGASVAGWCRALLVPPSLLISATSSAPLGAPMDVPPSPPPRPPPSPAVMDGAAARPSARDRTGVARAQSQLSAAKMCGIPPPRSPPALREVQLPVPAATPLGCHALAPGMGATPIVSPDPSTYYSPASTPPPARRPALLLGTTVPLANATRDSLTWLPPALALADGDSGGCRTSGTGISHAGGGRDDLGSGSGSNTQSHTQSSLDPAAASDSAATLPAAAAALLEAVAAAEVPSAVIPEVTETASTAVPELGGILDTRSNTALPATRLPRLSRVPPSDAASAAAAAAASAGPPLSPQVVLPPRSGVYPWSPPLSSPPPAPPPPPPPPPPPLPPLSASALRHPGAEQPHMAGLAGAPGCGVTANAIRTTIPHSLSALPLSTHSASSPPSTPASRIVLTPAAAAAAAAAVCTPPTIGTPVGCVNPVDEAGEADTTREAPGTSWVPPSALRAAAAAAGALPLARQLSPLGASDSTSPRRGTPGLATPVLSPPLVWAVWERSFCACFVAQHTWASRSAGDCFSLVVFSSFLLYSAQGHRATTNSDQLALFFKSPSRRHVRPLPCGTAPHRASTGTCDRPRGNVARRAPRGCREGTAPTIVQALRSSRTHSPRRIIAVTAWRAARAGPAQWQRARKPWRRVIGGMDPPATRPTAAAAKAAATAAKPAAAREVVAAVGGTGVPGMSARLQRCSCWYGIAAWPRRRDTGAQWECTGLLCGCPSIGGRG